MKYIKSIVVLICSLYSSVIFSAGLTADRTAVSGDESANISVTFNQQLTGDLYLAVENNNQLFFVIKKDNQVLFLDSNSVFGSQVTPFASGTFQPGDLPVYTLNAQGVAAGQYTFYQAVLASGDNPLTVNPNLWLMDLSTLTFNVNIVSNTPSTSNTPTSNTPTSNTPSTAEGFPEPGAGRFGQQANTIISDKYFTPRLVERGLGDYVDVKNSLAEWEQLTASEQSVTLYWDNDQLLGLFNGNLSVFDSLSFHKFTPLNVRESVIIHEPLTGGKTLAYPGCVGISNLGTHYRICGANSEVLIGSQIYSQRWTRLNNVNKAPLQAAAEKMGISLTEMMSRSRYELGAFLDVEEMMTPDQLSNIPSPFAFEMSISKVPGDFSENSCKNNSPIQYQGIPASVLATEVGFQSSLPENCQIDSNVLQHYYLNVRIVGLDEQNRVIEKSPCSNAIECRFKVLNRFD